MTEDFVGAGVAFPLHTDATGGVALVTRDTELREAIGLILGTAFGERPMRPQFGCGIHDYVFAPANDATASHLGHEVREALDRWEPRIDVTNVDVSLDNLDRSTFYIDIRYTVRATNDPRNLVFPFYVIPAEETAT